jgi:serine/threonine protein phosphatase PrpC
MGTTVVAALVSGDRLALASVGDSRMYRVREGEIIQLTEDHSLINDYIKMKRMTAEEAANWPHKNVIVRALGMKETVQVDVHAEAPRLGDCYIICSDGLSGMIADDEILDILMSTGDIIEGCRRLVARANEHGGEDNITAVLVRIDDGPSPNQTSTHPPGRHDDETTVRGGLPPVAVKPPTDDTPPAAPAAAPPAAPLIESEPTLPTGAVPPPPRDSGPPPSGGKRR